MADNILETYGDEGTSGFVGGRKRKSKVKRKPKNNTVGKYKSKRKK